MGKIDWDRDYGFSAPEKRYLLQDGKKYNLEGDEIDHVTEELIDPPPPDEILKKEFDKEFDNKEKAKIEMTKPDLVEALKDLGVSFPKNSTKEQLQDIYDNEMGLKKNNVETGPPAGKRS